MRIPNQWVVNSSLAFAIAFVALSILPACSVNVKKGDNDQDKKVDIETPMGGIHVSKNADVRDTGLPVYPGARLKEKEDNGEQKSANVNISGMGYALRVVAVEFESDDPPQKLITYYQDQLKKYGNVLQCRASKFGGNTRTTYHGKDSHASNELKCTGDNSGKVVELKVGTDQNEHIVSIQPSDSGKGSVFALVHLQTHSEEDTI
jgi:hypothetical protein